MKESINNYDDLLEMLDVLLQENSQFSWNNFYANREKQIPFFVNAPDENLVSYYEQGFLHSGRALELGCGPGRNAIYLAEHGYSVDAVDLSEEGIAWGRERAAEKNIFVNFINKSIFDLELEENTYDIIYDSGCFHHIAPHRRMSYLELLNKALKPNGYFGLTCFIPDGELGGANISDWEVYRSRSLQGGLGYTEEKLRMIFHEYEVIEIRKMKEIKQPNYQFGVPFLWTALFRKR
ncbi:class I SAM-dependent methyltransferase [Robertmurraya yapensis]|uniref:Class I SAM-dependent methyltransferase n=1 Tax=Bacillus yapensis TaxID=2492960 RepID=A0A3S0JS64_9BACI|nr:class I SAM-dependent methyltransferase [Bacillus yapensis]RTR27826.1 class I SAM-dependent methyltransferase [Bacillus yapensis]TKS94229.1 methyltransferase domain-containing protein [Bacillus yapensis]